MFFELMLPQLWSWLRSIANDDWEVRPEACANEIQRVTVHPSLPDLGHVTARVSLAARPRTRNHATQYRLVAPRRVAEDAKPPSPDCGRTRRPENGFGAARVGLDRARSPTRPNMFTRSKAGPGAACTSRSGGIPCQELRTEREKKKNKK